MCQHGVCLLQVYLPLHLMLHNWVFDGILADKSFEFFVACDDSSKPDKMWRSKYTLRQSMLPSFIPQSLAKKVSLLTWQSSDLQCILQILTIGKSINFVHQLCGEHSHVSSPALRTWYQDQHGHTSFQLMTGSSLKVWCV